jgi:hypothetical protein
MDTRYRRGISVSTLRAKLPHAGSRKRSIALLRAGREVQELLSLRSIGQMVEGSFGNHIANWRRRHSSKTLHPVVRRARATPCVLLRR